MQLRWAHFLISFLSIIYLIFAEVAFAAIPSTIPKGKIRKSEAIETVVLCPAIREEPIPEEPPTSLELLKPFLKPSLILDSKAQFLSAPYIAAEEDRRIEGEPGTLVFVRGIRSREETMYSILKGGRSFCHPVTHEPLGYEALVIGTAELKDFCDPALFNILKVDESIEVGSRLLPSYISMIPMSLKLRPAEATLPGFILSVRNGLDQIGVNDVVLISLGVRENVHPGDILQICQPIPPTNDPFFKGKLRRCKVRLPDKKAGKLLVFQAFEKLSVGIVLETYGPVHLLDRVKNP